MYNISAASAGIEPCIFKAYREVTVILTWRSLLWLCVSGRRTDLVRWRLGFRGFIYSSPASIPRNLYISIHPLTPPPRSPRFSIYRKSSLSSLLETSTDVFFFFSFSSLLTQFTFDIYSACFAERPGAVLS